MFILKSMGLFVLAAHAEIGGAWLAAYVGVFVAGSLAWGIVADRFRPDRGDITGALICLAGVAVIMYAPRASGV